MTYRECKGIALLRERGYISDEKNDMDDGDMAVSDSIWNNRVYVESTSKIKHCGSWSGY